MSKQILTMCLLVFVLVSGYAMGDDDQQESRRLMQHGEILPLQKILHTIDQKGDARVLEVELEVVEDRPIYEIELLDQEGKVWEYKVDAATGEIMETKQEE